MPSPVRSATAASCNRRAVRTSHKKRTAPTSRSETGWSVRVVGRTTTAANRREPDRSCCGQKTRTPYFFAALDLAIGVGRTRRTIARQEDRPIQVYNIAKLPQHKPGRHRETRAAHVANHDP